MSTCKDCLHYEVCQYHITEETDMTVNECSHGFKNKADYVEVVRCKIVSTLCFRICMVNVHKHIWELSDPMIFAVTVKERTENND